MTKYIHQDDNNQTLFFKETPIIIDMIMEMADELGYTLESFPNEIGLPPPLWKMFRESYPFQPYPEGIISIDLDLGDTNIRVFESSIKDRESENEE